MHFYEDILRNIRIISEVQKSDDNFSSETVAKHKKEAAQAREQRKKNNNINN